LQIEIEHLEKQVIPLKNAGNDQPQDRTKKTPKNPIFQVVGTLCHLDIAATTCKTVRTREIGNDDIGTMAEILGNSSELLVSVPPPPLYALYGEPLSLSTVLPDRTDRSSTYSSLGTDRSSTYDSL